MELDPLRLDDKSLVKLEIKEEFHVTLFVENENEEMIQSGIISSTRNHGNPCLVNDTTKSIRPIGNHLEHEGISDSNTITLLDPIKIPNLMDDGDSRYEPSDKHHYLVDSVLAYNSTSFDIKHMKPDLEASSGGVIPSVKISAFSESNFDQSDLLEDISTSVVEHNVLHDKSRSDSIATQTSSKSTMNENNQVDTQSHSDVIHSEAVTSSITELLSTSRSNSPHDNADKLKSVTGSVTTDIRNRLRPKRCITYINQDGDFEEEEEEEKRQDTDWEMEEGDDWNDKELENECRNVTKPKQNQSDNNTLSYNNDLGTLDNLPKVVNSRRMVQDQATCHICRKEFCKTENFLLADVCGEYLNCVMTSCVKTSLAKHMLNHHKDCPSVSNKKTRKNAKPDPLSNKFLCHFCGQLFVKKYNLKDHVNRHHLSLTPYKCNFCEKAYHAKSSLNVHIACMHETNKSVEMVCEVCGKVFKSKDSLKSHSYSHKEKSFECNYCSSKFVNPSKLRSHMTTHVGERNFECGECSKTFMKKFGLKRHIVLTHLKKKRFKCNKCTKSFQSKPNLIEHLLKHDGIRKYSCETCGKTFAQASHLEAHKFSHGEKKFVCHICGAKFNRNDNMKSHVKRHKPESMVK